MEKDEIREIKFLQIFFEHPGGLRPMELWNIVKERKICAKKTLYKLLDDFEDLIIKNELGRYTLKLGEDLIRMLQEPFCDVPKDIAAFFNTLFEEYKQLRKNRNELFEVASLYVAVKAKHMEYMKLLLAPFFYDARIREIWYKNERYTTDLLWEKHDELSQKLYGVQLSKLMTSKMVMKQFLNDYLDPLLGKELWQIKSLSKRIAELIRQLDIKAEAKQKLLAQLPTEHT
jgi:hypothetical protein